MATSIIHIVSTLQIVSGNTTTGIIASDVIEPPLTTLESYLPSGYVAHPQFGVAWKIYNESVTWEIANELCIRRGAHLATIDTAEKIEAVRKQDPWGKVKHVGFYLIESDTDWYNMRTGLSVPQSSLPWAEGEPNGPGRCARLKYVVYGLGRFPCTGSTAYYICEKPYP